MKDRKTAKNGILPAAASTAVALVMILLLINPERYTESCRRGIDMWATCVLPSLFPFFFLTAALTRLNMVGKIAKFAAPLTRSLYRTGGLGAYVYLMSAVSGYPVGSKLISELSENGMISREEATRMSCFCSTSGPLFVVGSVGAGMFGSAAAGGIMLAAHLLAGLLAGLCFRRAGGETTETFRPLPPRNCDNVLYESVYNAVVNVLVVGGFIALFYVLADMLADFWILALPTALFSLLLKGTPGGTVIAPALSAGVLECTRGCAMLAEAGLTPLTAALAAALVSFGGISITMQSAVYLKRAGVPVGLHVAAKIVHALFAFALCLLFFSF